MNRRRVKKLVDALRSGKYKQATHRLCVEDGSTGAPKMCCLGVACDISGLGKWVGGFPAFDYTIDGADFNKILPPQVAEWYGFLGGNPSVNTASGQMWLAALNDGGADFQEIAQAIEETYLRGPA